jgi:hypothetical protein
MTRIAKSGLSGTGLPARSGAAALLACCITQVWAVDQRRMNDVVERQNRNLPSMVANQLRQEKMEVSGSSIVYRYTHLGLSAAQLREMRLEATQRPYIFPRICQEADTGRMLREGVSFRYVYIGNDGGVGGQLQIFPADCR